MQASPFDMRSVPAQRLLLGAIVLGFVLLQLFKLSYRWVDDESWYLMPLPSIHAGSGFNIPSVPGDDVFWPQPPILTYLEAGLDRIAPLSAASARVIPLLAGVLTILAGFLFGRALFTPAAGLWTALFIATDNLVFLASRIVRPEILVTMFLAFGLFFGVKAMRADRRANLYACVAGLMAAGGVGSHPNGLLVPASIGVFWLLCCRFDKELFARIGCFAVVFVLATLPFVLWVVANDGDNHYASFSSHWLDRYGRNAAAAQSGFARMLTLVSSEWQGRYADFAQYPYRVHIALLSVALVVLSLFSRTRPIRACAVLVLMQLLFFIFVNNSNATVRYMTTVVPLVALLAAYWLLQAWRGYVERKDLVRGGCAAFIVAALALSELAGNLIYLRKIRDADYNAVVAEVSRLIPADSVIYGGMFWWIGLREHYTVVPYMRMPWPRAVQDWHPTFVIMDDWVMTGNRVDDNWKPLRQELNEYLAAHGKMVGTVDGGFYGQLKIWSLAP
jgi:4-amino-4-deoxy-L-arabinose transferase-like glycosyltransferase